MTLVSCTLACNLCGNETAERIGDADRDGQSLQTVLCQSCGLVWTDPRPSSEQTRKFYAEEYRLQYKSTYVPKRKHVYRETLRAIARFQEVRSLLQPKIKMLDVGCGGGFFPYVARTQGFDAQGIEPNQGFAEYASETFDVPTTNAFFQDVDLPEESFDLITLNHVLEHVEDPCATLGQLRKWLKTDGYLVVEVPNIEATYHAPKNRFHVGHLYNFNPVNLEHLGAKAGLAVHASKLVTSENHIHLTFQKRELSNSQNENYTLPGNYQRVSEILKRHTTLRHYVSTVPYTRFVSKQSQYRTERRAVRSDASPREIADALIATHFDAPSRLVA
ncbi:MAG: class I SAM-dependent methyltransferase [Planctomycetes bacterium]|nr:class I SAM-dependent methyltransferase [Planctomycetota bacterium]